MSRASGHNSIPRGVTLVELLVVVGIMLLLATIAIPAMRPMMENRPTREAARAINVFFGSTRNRAMESGRAHGVMFERLGRQPQASVLLRRVEVPPAYSGDLYGVVRVQEWTYTADTSWPTYPWYVPGGSRVLKVQVRYLDLSPGLILRGDLVQLNHQGPWYRIDFDSFMLAGNLPADFAPPVPDFPVETDPAKPGYGYINFFDPPGLTYDAAGWITSHVLTLTLDARSDYHSPFPRKAGGSMVVSNPVPFTIMRQPLPTADAPLQLTHKVVVDLSASGMDHQRPFRLVDPNAADNPPYNPIPLPVPLDMTDPVQRQKARPVIVMFSPNGSVDQVFHYQLQYDAAGDVTGGAYVGQHVAEPIHFLVGKWERMPLQPGGAPQAEDGLANWQDATNLWVTLNPQTGLVTVAELNADRLDPATNTYIPSSLRAAREFARQAQVSKGGR